MKSHKDLLSKLNNNPTYYVSAKFLKDHVESMKWGLNDAKFKEELDEMSPFDSYNFACHFRTVTQGDAPILVEIHSLSRDFIIHLEIKGQVCRVKLTMYEENGEHLRKCEGCSTLNSLIVPESHKDLFTKLSNQAMVYISSLMYIIRDKTTLIGVKSHSYKESKKKYVSRDISYISSKKYIQSENPTYRTINWQFAFNVWGHWRIIKGTGKNRSGEYCISGKTWVIPSVKNKHLELKNNIRIVK